MESGLDLNLLRTFITVYELHNLKAASIRLGVSESAVSKQLTRLHEQVGEVLFERTSSGLKPTHFSAQIYPEIREKLRAIEQTLVPVKFDPRRYDKPIRIVAFMNILEFWGAEIFANLRARFPNAPIELEAWSSDTDEQILAGAVTMGLHFFRPERSADIYQKTLCRDEMVAVVAAEYGHHPWQELITWPIVKLKSQGWNEDKYRYANHLKAQGLKLDIAVTVDNIAVAKALLHKGRYVTMLNRTCVGADLAVIAPPAPYNFELVVCSCVRLIDRHSPLARMVNEVLGEVLGT